ncbi:hypothetical protein B296_00001449 [Ensete ventricosum]|uniref:Uncharacterized protein n=1 Tax=Ensete ventricosum TaxID=4639 RepID=A0A427B4W9_ENSVE|nr:hypothetical protein B296_00001449 [Ensete ventricosum]
MVINLPKVEFQSIFRAPSRKFKILAIPNVLAHGKSYEHGCTKKCDGHKLCVKLSFDRFFVHHLINSEYYQFRTYCPIRSRTSMILRKNTTVIKFVKSRVSIDFSCKVMY